MKRGKRFCLLVLFAVFIVLVIVNFTINKIYFNKITAKASQVDVQLIIMQACGNGICGVNETCSNCAADCGACVVVPPSAVGGGGGAVVKQAVTFDLDKELIKVNTKIGETFKVSLGIKNTYLQPLSFEILTNMDDFIIFSEKDFKIDAGKEKEIFLTFYTTEDTEPGVYTGEIKVLSEGVMKIIPVIFEVESKKVLFDISLDIPPNYKELFPGEDLLLQLTLFNLGDVGNVDVIITYLIKDFEGNIILTQEDVVAVETQASFSRTINLPSDLKEGDYVAIAQTKYDGTMGTSSNIFHIKSKKEFILEKSHIITLLIMILIVLIVVFLIRREHKKLRKSVGSYHKEIRKASKKINQEKKRVIKENKISQKLKSKFGLLKQAYSEGYIRKKSYEKGKKKIRTAHNKLKR